MGWIAKLLGAAPNTQQIQAKKFYQAAVVQARCKDWYLKGDVQDSIDGRFDMLILILSLIIYHLQSKKGAFSARLVRYLIEFFIEDMDNSLREMGVGDLSVGKQVKTMADALNGRSKAYSEALRDALPNAHFSNALLRNLYRDQPPTKDAMLYVENRVLRLHDQLKGSDLEQVANVLTIQEMA